VLAQFATGVTPDAEDARLVLARVGVVTCSDCPEDASFLETELLERLETTTMTSCSSVASWRSCSTAASSCLTELMILARPARLRW
jgi:hypothetical protein